MSNQLSNLKKRLLQSIKAKCVDGVWSADDLGLLVTGYTRGVQCWGKDGLLDEQDERDGPLPDVDALNEKIPQNEWKPGLNNQPEPPWRVVFVVYLTDLETAELYTWINSGWGAQQAYEQLTEKIERMSRLRGQYVTAIVKPSRKPMKIKKLNITKQRPHFEIVEWRDLGPPLPPQQSPVQLAPPADNGSSAKSESSTLPWEDLPANPAATTGTAPAEKKPVTVGKPVAPITTEEEFNDTLEDIYRNFGGDPPGPRRSSSDDDFIF